jgi:hypothetical protein
VQIWRLLLTQVLFTHLYLFFYGVRDVLRNSKSGKKTPGVGYFWSGCAGKTKWGLEIAGLAAIDIENHSAFHLEAVQTVGLKEDETLVSHYL